MRHYQWTLLFIGICLVFLIPCICEGKTIETNEIETDDTVKATKTDKDRLLDITDLDEGLDKITTKQKEEELEKLKQELGIDSELEEAIEKLFTVNILTSSTQSYLFNGAAAVYVFFWGVVLLIIKTAVVCYWVGCEYDVPTVTTTAPVGYGESVTSSYSGRSFNTFDGINWEQFTILDFLAIAEDAYRNFDPANLSCQQRLICEIHQNADTMGASAKTMVDWLSYLQYAEVLSLPEEVKALAEEYLDAADRGRNKEKECGVVYDGCNFSIKKLMKNLSHNEIKK